MDLIFWRHAEAEDERDGLDDLDRALTKTGQKQAARVGAWLDAQLPRDTLILCSPALRCQQTALALGRDFRIVERIAPGAAPAAVLEAAQWPDAPHPVMIVGHQPTLGQTLAQLLRLQDTNCGIRKGQAWWLRAREGELQVWAVQSPETA
ncbi:histidine phosphatase family protein [Ramlibacter sp.]|uniref:SixA phosphatase family protein n=1 Tax=Ramlibacter sp. TaxID=1917967 RepID=UPI00261A00F9|nr:histidine phosphatase family protein [Ramlibacter sp.]MDB5956261.1 phosphohistidine phosphatase SixA [Ramlibacter sp.]